MKIAIVGFDREGKAAYKYWNSASNHITICDRSTDIVIPDGTDDQLGDEYLANLDRFDLISRTPGLHPRDIVAANPSAPDILSKVTSNTNVFLEVCPTRNIIGITGTKGKGTTSTLVAKILAASGKSVHLGGNIGIAPLELLANGIQPEDWVVLELSNFQLIDLRASPRLAACLMIVPEHMDWHTDMDEYVTAKAQLFRHQTAADSAVYYADNEYSKHVVSQSAGTKIPYMQPPGAHVVKGNIIIDDTVICRKDEIKLLGAHNWQNVCAAVTVVWQISQDVAAIRSVVTSFTGLEHRLEFVRELNGISYYDDSFGTTPVTAMVAIEAFKQSKVVILGGSDKGADFNALARTVAENNVRCVVIIGIMGPSIEAALRHQGYTAVIDGGQTMAEIVAAATAVAHPGDAILLSTACASFDMFANYKDRGEQFKSAVAAL